MLFNYNENPEEKSEGFLFNIIESFKITFHNLSYCFHCKTVSKMLINYDS